MSPVAFDCSLMADRLKKESGPEVPRSTRIFDVEAGAAEQRPYDESRQADTSGLADAP